MRSASTFAIALLFTAAAQAGGLVTTDIFGNITCCSGVGVPYSGFVGTLSTDDVQFFTDNNGNWQPFGLSSFGANIEGYLAVAAPGAYTLSLTAVNGAALFVDGTVINEPGDHPVLTDSATLDFAAAGIVPFDIQAFELGTGSSGVDLDLPAGLSFATPVATPEPSSLLLAGLGFAGLVRFRRRSRTCRATRAIPTVM